MKATIVIFMVVVSTSMFIGKVWCKYFKIKVEIADNIPAGCSVTLLCKYTLPMYMVYSVKWYRGSYEFYRYLPKEDPPDKSFDKPGITVQTELSNGTQVTLKNVSQALSGPFTCEVSAEEPTFVTLNHTATLHVYELSKVQRPEISTNEMVYTVGKPFLVICHLPIYPRVGPLTVAYKMNVYHDGEKVNPELVTAQRYRIFVVPAHLLKWNLSATKCFQCEVSVCNVHKKRSDTICVPSTSGCSTFLKQQKTDLCNILYMAVHIIIAMCTVLLYS